MLAPSSDGTGLPGSPDKPSDRGRSVEVVGMALALAWEGEGEPGLAEEEVEGYEELSDERSILEEAAACLLVPHV